MSEQKITIGTVIQLKGQPYECTRITRTCESYYAYEGGDYMQPLTTKLNNVKVLKRSIEPHKEGDTIEIDYERIWFQSVDKGVGPFVVYNYFNIRKVKEEDEQPVDDSSTTEEGHLKAEDDQQRIESRSGVRQEGTD